MTIDILRDPPPAAVLPVGRVLRDAPRVLRAAARRRVLRPAARQPARHCPRRGATWPSYVASARSLDRGVGAVLDALDRYGHARQHAGDLHHRPRHRLPRRQGHDDRPRLGVMLIMRGPGGFLGGKASDALVSHIDIFPTICDLVGIAQPGLAAGPVADAGHHAARPTRSATRSSRRRPTTPRTSRSGRSAPRAGSTCAGSSRRTGRCSPNTDDSPRKDAVDARRVAAEPLATEQLYDLELDPNEAWNRIDDPRRHGTADELRPA